MHITVNAWAERAEQIKEREPSEQRAYIQNESVNGI